jgi:hypothetical protein
MPPRRFRVSFDDSNGIGHAVEALADSLFEAAALGLALLKKATWVEGNPGR